MKVPVIDHYDELVNRHQEKIHKFYSMTGKLSVIDAQMKVIPDSGTYYKFLIKDAKDKQAYFKIDEVHPQANWNTEEWKEKHVPKE